MANTIKEKELKTDWDALTASDSTKAVGHIKNLIPTEKSFIPARKRKGID
jgi:hypothetical protein